MGHICLPGWVESPICLPGWVGRVVYTPVYASQALFVGVPAHPVPRCAVLYVRYSPCVHPSGCRMCTFGKEVRGGWDPLRKEEKR